ncbi:MAG: CPBP family intramembrane glutamic endopeptidase [Planctomycetota bacterium]
MTTPQKIARWFEMLALFVGAPVLLWQFPKLLGGPRLFGFLWLMALGCAVMLVIDRRLNHREVWEKRVAVISKLPVHERIGLWKRLLSSLCTAVLISAAWLIFDRRFDRRQLWNAKEVLPAMGWIVGRWLVFCIIITAAFGLVAGRELPGLTLEVPTGLFSLFYREGLPWFLPLLITLFYPWVSVYPQNVIYRAFFCHRYRPILGGGWGLILVSAAAFAFGHIMFNNWIVLLLTFIGGIIFTRTYLKSRSLLLATIEHAMYGLFCFYIGVGVFLLYGASG